jgi:hypothetical protein
VRLSVVIPALNEERHLAQLLSDIQRQSQDPRKSSSSTPAPATRASALLSSHPSRWSSTASRPSRVAGT